MEVRGLWGGGESPRGRGLPGRCGTALARAALRPSPVSRAQGAEVNVGSCEILRFQEAVKNKFLKRKNGSFLFSLFSFLSEQIILQHFPREGESSVLGRLSQKQRVRLTHADRHTLSLSNDESAVCSRPSPPSPSPRAWGLELCLIISQSPQPAAEGRAQGRAQGRRWRVLMYE